jgi:hypothetical protein
MIYVMFLLVKILLAVNINSDNLQIPIWVYLKFLDPFYKQDKVGDELVLLTNNYNS